MGAAAIVPAVCAGEVCAAGFASGVACKVLGAVVDRTV